MAWPFSWATQTITRIRPGVREVRGSEIRDWNNVDELVISNCSMQPAGNTLSQDGRVLGVYDGYTCYAPANADIQAGDRIEFNGQGAIRDLLLQFLVIAFDSRKCVLERPDRT